MGRADKRNQVKQKERRRKERLENEAKTFSKDGAYKVFTLIHLSDTPVDFSIDLKYNYVIHTSEQLNDLEASYLIRCSDLLLLTVNSDSIDPNKLSLVKRFSPTIVIIYQRKNKSVAKNISKQLGGPSICEISMLSSFLNNIKTVCTSVVQHRPYMLATSTHREGDYLTIEGFMKLGLQTDRVVINGSCEGIVEEVLFEDCSVKGEELRKEEDQRQLSNCDGDKEGDEDSDINNNEEYCEDDEGQCENDEEDYDDEQEIEYDMDEAEGVSPEYDLIEKYKDYRGVRNMATCTFKGQEAPPHYKDLIFFKNPGYLRNTFLKRPSIIPKNKFVKLRIRLLTALPESQFVVMFGLYEFETRPTILNYEFSSTKPLPKNLLVDNGYRVFHASTILSRNLSHNAFQEDSSLERGIVSFIGPFSFFSPVIYLICDDGNVVRGSNGFSQDRMFFDMVTLQGKPMKVMKRHVVIRGMFYNREQVEYFSRIKLEAGHGNVGFIKKPLGTKGLFKAHFSQPIKHGEKVTMSLYKRVFL